MTLTRKRIIFLIIFFSTLIFVFIFLGIFSKVFAYQLLQTDDSAQVSTTEQSIKQTLGNPAENFVLGSADGKVNLKIKFQGHPTFENNPQFYMWENSTPLFYATNCGTAGAGFNGFWQPDDTCYSEAESVYLKDYQFNTANTYALQPYISSGYGRFYGSTDPNSYPNGACVSNCDILADMYFILGETPPSYEIEITFPENTTSTPDFNYWGLSGTTLTAPAVIHINWGVSTSSWSGFTNYILDNTGDFDVSAPKSFTIPVGNYYARAWLAMCDPYEMYSTCIPSTWTQPYGLGLMTPLATSTLISFTITGENPYTGGYYGTYYPEYTPTSTATSSEWVITCDPDDPLWSRSICQISKWTLEGMKGLLQFLFVPKQEDLTRFGELKAELENKPPIGYFYVIKNAWNNNLSSTSTPAFTLESATSTLATPVYNPLKTGFTSILWLSAGMFVFNRIRHLVL